MIFFPTDKPNRLPTVLIPLAVFASCAVITFTAKFAAHTALLSNAILLDLLVTAPLLYWLIAPATNTSKWVTVRIFMVGLLLAGFLLQAHTNPVLQFIKTWMAPVIELVVITAVVRRFYTAGKKAREGNTGPVDFLPHCRSMLQQVTGHEKAGNILASEIAVLYYGLFSRSSKTINYTTTFTNYKENGLPIVLYAILGLFLVETAGVHFLVNVWSVTAAWVLTALSLYTCLQLYAHIKAIKARPVVISDNALHIHNGLAGDAHIPFNNIERIELSGKVPANRQAVKIALLKGLENHNIVVYVKSPVTVTKVFGIQKQADVVLFFVDRPKEFILALQAHAEVSTTLRA